MNLLVNKVRYKKLFTRNMFSKENKKQETSISKDNPNYGICQKLKGIN